MAILTCSASALFFTALAAQVQGAPKTLEEGLKVLEKGKTFEFEMDKPKDSNKKDAKAKTSSETAATTQKYTATLTATKYDGIGYIDASVKAQRAIVSFTAVVSGSPSGAKPTLGGEVHVMTPHKNDDVNTRLYIQPSIVEDGGRISLWDNPSGQIGKPGPGKANYMKVSKTVKTSIADAIFTLWLGSPTQKKTADFYYIEPSGPVQHTVRDHNGDVSYYNMVTPSGNTMTFGPDGELLY